MTCALSIHGGSVFFFKQKTAYVMRISDWSSDVCSSDLVDYFGVNVSSPNTPGLRELQEKGPLTAILRSLKDAGDVLAADSGRAPKPVLLKIAPDLRDRKSGV